MKKLFLIASVLLAACVVSCKKETPVEDAVTLKSPASVTVPVTGDVVSISFNSSVAWTATSSQTWLSLSPASGEAGDVTIKASAVKNETYDARTAEVTITAGTKTAKVTVTQGQVDAVVVKETSFEIPAEGGEIDIPVAANVDVTVTIPEAIDWVHMTPPNKGLVDSVVKLYVDASYDVEARTANVTVGETVVAITQRAFEPYFDWVEPYNVNQWSFYWGEVPHLPQEGFDITIDISTNVEWRAFFSVWDNEAGAMVDSYDLGWCQLSFDETHIYLKGTANDTYVERSEYLYCECTINGAVSGDFGALCYFVQDGLVPEAGASVMWTKLLSEVGVPSAPYHRLAYKTVGGEALLITDGEMVHEVSPADGTCIRDIVWGSVKPTSIASDDAGNIIVADDHEFMPAIMYDVYYTRDVNEEPMILFTHEADFSGTIGGWRVRGDLSDRAVVTGFVGGTRYWAGWEIDNFNVSMDNYYATETGGQARGPIAVDGDAWNPESGAVMSLGPRLNEGIVYRAYDTDQRLYYLADAYTPNWLVPYDWKMISEAGAGGNECQNNMDIIDYNGRRIMAYTQGLYWGYGGNADVYVLDVTNPNDTQVIAILDGSELASVDSYAVAEDYGWATLNAYVSADVKLHAEEGVGLVCYVVNSTLESLSKVLITF